MYCASCGAMMGDDARYCPHCGMPTTEVEHTEGDFAGLTIDVETGKQIGETAMSVEPTRMLYDRPAAKTEVAQQAPYQPLVQQPYAPAGQAYEPTVQQAYEPTVQQAYEPTVQQAYEPTVQQPYPQNVQQPYEPTVQQSPYQQPGYSAAAYQARRASKDSQNTGTLVMIVALAFVVGLVAILHFSGVAPWVQGGTPAEAQPTPEATGSGEETEQTPTAPEQPAQPVQTEQPAPSEQTAQSEQQSEDASQASNEYVLPDSATHSYSADELQGLSDWELYVARNEIYARYGRQFRNSDLQEYFGAQPWYHGTIAPDSFDESVLNEVERANISTMYEIEKARGSQYL